MSDMNNSMTQTVPEGLIVLDKPKGMTSFDCVARIRRLFSTKKVGHTGTLDPDATGILPILIGRAAKAAELLTAEDKHYIATLRLGLQTDTEDIGGTVLSRCDQIPGEEAVQAVLAQFRGDIMQVPPMYSALKRDGQKLCDLARAGVTVEREARPITIHALTARTVMGVPTDYILDVSCSKGTYIRTLCADIGASLGCGGVMAELRRVASGNFTLDVAHTLQELEEMTEAERFACLLPTEALFSDCREIFLPAFYERLCDNGHEIYLSKLRKTPTPPYTEGEFLRIKGENKGFFALGRVQTFTLDGGETALAVKPIKKFVL